MTFNDDFYDGIFEKALRSEYSQLTTLKVDEKAFFKNSIFDVGNVSGRRKLLDAELLAVWQFGGTAITQDVLATCQLPQPDESYCLVSLDMISCPKQCSAFLYQNKSSAMQKGFGLFWSLKLVSEGGNPGGHWKNHET
ncbi:unnamed protein product [Nesidiocoris tenuis]|uniref:Uncharacterized protein n=1 Tax=Nesidiocoris tenuis TaxID=355587 RepID=A0A6H5GVH0_9HEMI|nr:unnamed protein product [Nesidiocoris tenuis]